MSKFKRVLRWGLTVFMVCAGIVYFPSFSSLLCFLFAVLAAPIKPLQRFWTYQVKLRGAAKVLIMAALFIGAVMTAPTDTLPEAPETHQDASEAQDVSEDVQVSTEDSADKQEPAQPVQESGETTQEAPEQPQSNEPESEPQEAEYQSTAPAPAPAVTPEPEPDPAPQENQTNSRTVYITPTGKRYHYDNNCNDGTYIPSTLAEAQAMGLTPCKKCAGG